MPPSFLKAQTVFIPKSEDETELGRVPGYRPIALYNVDYRMFAKVLTKRLQNVMKDFVGEHQTYGIQGRLMPTNVHVARAGVLFSRGTPSGEVSGRPREGVRPRSQPCSFFNFFFSGECRRGFVARHHDVLCRLFNESND